MRELLDVLWSGRWLIAFFALIASVSIGGASRFIASQYSSTVTISVVPDSLARSRTGLSTPPATDVFRFPGVAGVNVTDRASTVAESLAVLKSESLTESYIQANGLLPILFSDKWDQAHREWKSGNQKTVPTLWEASRFFKENIRTVTTDYLSRLVRLTITWKDPQLAARWANGLVEMANSQLRGRAIAESERRIAFLKSELAITDQIEVKRSVAVLIERESENLVLARGSKDFGIKIVDPAVPSETPSYPNLRVWAAMGAVFGLFSGIVLVFARYKWNRRARPQLPGYLSPKLWIGTEPLFRPSTLATLGLFLSAAAWFFPDIGGLKRGYDQPAHFTIQSVVLMADWWLMIYLGLRSGEIVGERISLRLTFARQIESLESNRIFVLFTALTALGLALTYAKILSSLSLVGALAFIAKGSGNELKASLYEQYSAGILSLRYLVIYSASLAVYRFVYVRRRDGLYAVNFLLLLASALLSSRLIFVATVLASLFLVLQRFERIRIRPLRIGLGALVVFIILASLNASRNANYYEKDNLYFWGGGASSIISYLSAPFQSSIGTGNHILEISGAPEDSYRDYVDIDETLNTNSSFVQNIETFGAVAWPGMALLTFSAGFLFAGLQRFGRTMFLLPCAAILYASSELWRLDLFRQGIFLVWLGGGIVLPLLMSSVPNFRLFRHVRPMGG